MHNLRDEMPDMMENPEAAAQWMLTKVCANLGDAKLWPVRLATVKFSDALGTMACMDTDPSVCV